MTALESPLRPSDADIDYALCDADQHYYEAQDCLTRHLDKKYKNVVNGSTSKVAPR